MPKRDDQQDIIFKDFQNGIADSPHLGYASMKNLDITSTPGVVKINYKAKKVSGTTVTGLIKFFTQYTDFFGDTTYYGVDTTGKIYYSTNSGDSWTVLSGNRTFLGSYGINVYKHWLLVHAGGGSFDAYGPLNSELPEWHTDILPHNTSSTSALVSLVGQDDIFYFTTQKGLGSIKEVSGQTFDPTDAATYVLTDPALTLPTGYSVTCLTELNRYLMIGTVKGNERAGDIFSWDRSAPTFNLPVRLHEFGVRQLIVIDNRLYAIAGREHTIYVSDTVNAQEVRRISRMMVYDESIETPTLDGNPASIMSSRGKLCTGISSFGNGVSPCGVWSLKDGVVTFEHQISTGDVEAVDGWFQIGALLPIDEDQYLISWQVGGTGGGIDKVTKTERYTGYAASFETPLYPVGLPLVKRTFRQIEFELAKPLATGQGVKVYFRRNLYDAYGLLDTYDFSAIGAKAFWNKPAGKIKDATYIQLKVELTTGSATYTTPELREIRLR